MPPKKLSNSDKQEILDRYRQSDETTVTLAAQYGVSTSTISRLLKQSLSESTYEALVQRKRQNRFHESDIEQETIPGLKSLDSITSSPSSVDDIDDEADDPIPQRRLRKRSPSGFISAEQLAASVAHLSQLEQAPNSRGNTRRRISRSQPDDFSAAADLDLELEDDLEGELEAGLEPKEPLNRVKRVAPVIPPIAVTSTVAPPILATPILTNPVTSPVTASSAPILASSGRSASVLETPETFGDLEEPDEELDDLDDDLDDDDLDELDDDYDESDPLSSLDSMQLQPSGQLQILPFVESSLPRTCYIVVDRASELITRPLRDFANTGAERTSRPVGREEQDKTLPIFDNHRVAKRFLRRMQRIVKVPDGRVFQKVKPYLQAKGITHLLIDGQVYSLQ
jgi:hypothetical protein